MVYPPTLGKDAVIFGIHGGNNWFGSAFDPYKQVLYIPTNHIPYKLRIFPTSWEDTNLVNKLNSDEYLIYKNKCSSCHKPNRNGYLKADKVKEKEIIYVPSLVGLTIFDPLKDKLKNLENLKSKHKELDLDNKEFLSLIKLFKDWDKRLLNENYIHMESYWLKYFDPNGAFINKPPIAEIVALDIISGKIIWKTTWGYENTKDGLKKRYNT